MTAMPMHSSRQLFFSPPTAKIASPTRNKTITSVLPAAVDGRLGVTALHAELGLAVR